MQDAHNRELSTQVDRCSAVNVVPLFSLMLRLNMVDTYWGIILPQIASPIAEVAIFAFVLSWNNFLWPFIVISGNDMMTVPMGLATVPTSFGIRYAQIMATAVLGGIPVLIVFLFFQHQIVQGIAGTGLKE